MPNIFEDDKHGSNSQWKSIILCCLPLNQRYKVKWPTRFSKKKKNVWIRFSPICNEKSAQDWWNGRKQTDFKFPTTMGPLSSLILIGPLRIYKKQQQRQCHLVFSDLLQKGNLAPLDRPGINGNRPIRLDINNYHHKLHFGILQTKVIYQDTGETFSATIITYMTGKSLESSRYVKCPRLIAVL